MVKFKQYLHRQKKLHFSIFSFCPGFPEGPELSSALKDRDQFEDPPTLSSSAPSPSLSVTPPNESPSPIINVFGSGSSMVTTATNEHPPTLLPASAKPQVTPTTLKGRVCCASVWLQCGGVGVEGEGGLEWGHRVNIGLVIAAPLPQTSYLILEKGTLNLKLLLVKNLLQQSNLTDSWSQCVWQIWPCSL